MEKQIQFLWVLGYRKSAQKFEINYAGCGNTTSSVCLSFLGTLKMAESKKEKGDKLVKFIVKKSLTPKERSIRCCYRSTTGWVHITQDSSCEECGRRVENIVTLRDQSRVGAVGPDEEDTSGRYVWTDQLGKDFVLSQEEVDIVKDFHQFFGREDKKTNNKIRKLFEKIRNADLHTTEQLFLENKKLEEEKKTLSENIQKLRKENGLLLSERDSTKEILRENKKLEEEKKALSENIEKLRKELERENTLFKKTVITLPEREPEIVIELEREITQLKKTINLLENIAERNSAKMSHIEKRKSAEYDKLAELIFSTEVSLDDFEMTKTNSPAERLIDILAVCEHSFEELSESVQTIKQMKEELRIMKREKIRLEKLLKNKRLEYKELKSYDEVSHAKELLEEKGLVYFEGKTKLTLKSVTSWLLEQDESKQVTTRKAIEEIAKLIIDVYNS